MIVTSLQAACTLYYRRFPFRILTCPRSDVNSFIYFPPSCEVLKIFGAVFAPQSVLIVLKDTKALTKLVLHRLNRKGVGTRLGAIQRSERAYGKALIYSDHPVLSGND